MIYLMIPSGKFGTFFPLPPVEIRCFAVPDCLDALFCEQAPDRKQILPGDQRYSLANPTHPTGTAGAVYIVFGGSGKIVIKNMAYLGKIQAASCNIGGNHHTGFALFETIENRGSRPLVQAAVDILHGFDHPPEFIVKEGAVSF